MHHPTIDRFITGNLPRGTELSGSLAGYFQPSAPVIRRTWQFLARTPVMSWVESVGDFSLACLFLFPGSVWKYNIWNYLAIPHLLQSHSFVAFILGLRLLTDRHLTDTTPHGKGHLTDTTQVFMDMAFSFVIIISKIIQSSLFLSWILVYFSLNKYFEVYFAFLM